MNKDKGVCKIFCCSGKVLHYKVCGTKVDFSTSLFLKLLYSLSCTWVRSYLFLLYLKWSRVDVLMHITGSRMASISKHYYSTRTRDRQKPKSWAAFVQERKVARSVGVNKLCLPLGKIFFLSVYSLQLHSSQSHSLRSRCTEFEKECRDCSVLYPKVSVQD